VNKEIMADYSAQSIGLKGTIPGADAVRATAFANFEKHNFPFAKTEDWRYSDMRLFHKKTFGLATHAATPKLPEALGEVAARFVFVNGRYDEDLSDLGDVWQALSIRPLANHFMSNEYRVNELIGGTDGVSCLNTALMRDGLVLSVPAGVEIDDPIEIVHIMSEANNQAAHMRHVIEMGEFSAIKVIERFVGDDSNYWTNIVLQARVTEGAKLSHIRVQEEGLNAVHTAKSYINLGGGAEYICTNVALGGKMSRFDAQARILVDGSKATINGIALAGTDQSHDMHVHISHDAPHSSSDQVFRTVADKRGKTSFQGKVTVAKDAQRTLADQSFKALIFDKTAEANAKPELEILADDVKCSHGATVGQLDEKAVFYLTSRGIDPATARQMLVAAFTAEALEKIGLDDVKEALSGRIASWMLKRAITTSASDTERKNETNA
jgi:Fe-S cluster assembly protein SufD